MSLHAPVHPDSDLHIGACDPFSFEAAEGQALGVLPAGFQGKITVDAIHDGACIPPEFLLDHRGRAIDPAEFRAFYERERDWGAALVAARLAGALGLAGYNRVNIARVLLDYGRFPGITVEDADYLRRFAINYPFSDLLSHEQKLRLLEHYYDRMSATMDGMVSGRIIKIAVHTYDRLNASGTVRPHVSLVTRALAYQQDSRLPQGVFDPLYPDVLAEFTADRILTDRISLDLEKGGIPVAHNYPYCLPEGSIEVRHQVWSFFNFVAARFQEEHPDTVGLTGFKMVWDMLLDTNLRSTESDTLRSFLHVYRRAPVGQEARFAEARVAYQKVRAFVERDKHRIVDDYRFWAERPSSIGIEVRKDLVWEFDRDERPVRPRLEGATRVAEAIAAAIIVYLNEDRCQRVPREQTLERLDPWYRGWRASSAGVTP